jgi:hypothetical protein
MTRLSDTQAVILSAAARRADGNVLPLPASLRGGAATKVIGALLSRGLIRERITDGLRRADAAMNTIWRNEPDGRGVLLLVTAAGLGAIGVEPADEAPVVSAANRRGRPRKVATPDDAPAPRKSRDGTKQAKLIEMLRRRQGATIAQIVAATGWQPHTVRGAMSGALRKKLGLEVTSEKVENRGRVYKLPPA